MGAFLRRHAGVIQSALYVIILLLLIVFFCAPVYEVACIFTGFSSLLLSRLALLLFLPGGSAGRRADFSRLERAGIFGRPGECLFCICDAIILFGTAISRIWIVFMCSGDWRLGYYRCSVLAGGKKPLSDRRKTIHLVLYGGYMGVVVWSRRDRRDVGRLNRLSAAYRQRLLEHIEDCFCDGVEGHPVRFTQKDALNCGMFSRMQGVRCFFYEVFQ